MEPQQTTEWVWAASAAAWWEAWAAARNAEAAVAAPGLGACFSVAEDGGWAAGAAEVRRCFRVIIEAPCSPSAGHCLGLGPPRRLNHGGESSSPTNHPQRSILTDIYLCHTCSCQ
jgi:hypothetical protein